MARAGRVILAILTGAAVWAVLWNVATLGAQAAFPKTLAPGQPITHTGILLAYVLYSVVLSLLAGFVTAAVGGKDPMGAVWALATLQLAIGIFVELSYWSLMPVWYHLLFLALVVPATVYGGILKSRRRSPPAGATT
jgi:hypothetical protein